MTPCCRSSESITDVPRSLNEHVGLNHSHLKCTVAPANWRATSGVQPSPSEIGASHASGNAAAYRQRLRRFCAIWWRPIPGSGVTSSGCGSPDASSHQRGLSSENVAPVAGLRY